MPCLHLFMGASAQPKTNASTKSALSKVSEETSDSFRYCNSLAAHVQLPWSEHQGSERMHNLDQQQLKRSPHNHCVGQRCQFYAQRITIAEILCTYSRAPERFSQLLQTQTNHFMASLCLTWKATTELIPKTPDP